jgi:hypothetical protein
MSNPSGDTSMDLEKVCPQHNEEGNEKEKEVQQLLKF